MARGYWQNISLSVISVYIVPSQSNKPFFTTFIVMTESGRLVQRVPALRVFWDLEKTVLHEIRVSGTVLWSPTNANSPTYTYISQKPC